jgi:heme-degrading monooxygenase HmoA
MIIHTVKFETELSESEVLARAMERADQFRAIPGLLQKYYVKLGQPNQYGGVYIWDSEQSLNSYRESELAATIPTAYAVKGQPAIEIIDVLFQLRD